MAALEAIGGSVVAAGAVVTAITVNPGDSLTVRYSPQGRRIFFLTDWVDSQATGLVQVHSPRMHDNTQGIRRRHVASEVYPLTPRMVAQQLIAQDTLIVEMTGSAVALDRDNWEGLLYYEDLPGSNGRFCSYDRLMKFAVNEFAVENTIIAGVAGGYSGEEALNADNDLFKANTDYALVGYLTNIEQGSIVWKGPDTGNLRVGGPGNETNKNATRTWFVELSNDFGRPLIPVVNSANRAGTTVGVVNDENAASPIVNSLFVQLAPGWDRP